MQHVPRLPHNTLWTYCTLLVLSHSSCRAQTLRSTLTLFCHIPDCFDFSSDAEISLTVCPSRLTPRKPAANHQPGGQGSLPVAYEGRQGVESSGGGGLFPLDSPNGLASFKHLCYPGMNLPRKPRTSSWRHTREHQGPR